MKPVDLDMTSYQCKPIAVEAFCFSGSVFPPWFQQMIEHGLVNYYEEAHYRDDALWIHCKICTPHGELWAVRGNWIVWDQFGGVAVWNEEEFVARYSAAEVP